LTVFVQIRGNNEVVVFQKEKVQPKPERKATPKREYESEPIGMFLAWTSLLWAFTLLLAASLVLTAY
jgi:hypothetical protein